MHVTKGIQLDEEGIDDFNLEEEKKGGRTKGLLKYFAIAGFAFMFGLLIIALSQNSQKQTEQAIIELGEQSNECGDGICSSDESCSACFADCACQQGFACNLQSSGCEQINIDSLAKPLFGNGYELLEFTQLNGEKYYIVRAGGKLETVTEHGRIADAT